jgi:hypothetical protein
MAMAIVATTTIGQGHVQVYARLRHIKRTMQDARARVAI